ncbi:GHKL domain-containing protein [uncultured Lactobacillus sp.]|uniref:sensor histidine kinase n=1 Tax=uncultured Lactobacillus sp. TaxID=153152 RepID=UPI002666E33A|nr:GHKL domain-containing protein [uncultured Lactobacillus sp.]
MILLYLLDASTMMLTPAIKIALFLRLLDQRPASRRAWAMFLGIWLIGVIDGITIESVPSYFIDLPFEIFELTLLVLTQIKGKKVKQAVSSALIIGILGLLEDIIVNIISWSFPETLAASLWIDLGLLLTGFLLAWPLLPKIRKYISDVRYQTNCLFLLSYLYVSTIFAYVVGMQVKKMSVGLAILLGILAVQGIYAVLSFSLSIKNQTALLNEAEERHLQVQNRQLYESNQQLKSYAASLEQDEDRLRRFKHDYRNILSSLKLAAAQNDSQQLLEKLNEYSRENFDEHALAKFQDVNHIHDDLLKSIVITKLSKIYDQGIPYRFSCQKDIDHLPLVSEMEKMDLVRVIGISFDNAIEASSGLKGGRIEAMFYQENGDFEFVIKNKTANIPSPRIFEPGYTSKDRHAGLGLEIVNKYAGQMIVDIDTTGNDFTFSLMVLKEGEK